MALNGSMSVHHLGRLAQPDLLDQLDQQVRLEQLDRKVQLASLALLAQPDLLDQLDQQVRLEQLDRKVQLASLALLAQPVLRGRKERLARRLICQGMHRWLHRCLPEIQEDRLQPPVTTTPRWRPQRSSPEPITL